jgi:hypothetical protein
MPWDTIFPIAVTLVVVLVMFLLLRRGVRTSMTNECPSGTAKQPMPGKNCRMSDLDREEIFPEQNHKGVH